MTQPSLFASKAPRVSDREIAWMLAVLDGCGWVKAWQLKFDSLYQGSRSVSDRTLRAIAAASQGRIISGQKGYARTDQASVEDVNHAAAWLQHQGEAMIRRAKEIQQVLNGRLVRSA